MMGRPGRRGGANWVRFAHLTPPNWVRFARSGPAAPAGRPCRPAPLADPPAADWLCFASLAPAPEAPSRPARRGIGFVLHDRQVPLNPCNHLPQQQLTSFCLIRKLGSFRTFDPGQLGSFRTFRLPGPWPTGPIGFVLHNRLARARRRSQAISCKELGIIAAISMSLSSYHSTIE